MIVFKVLWLLKIIDLNCCNQSAMACELLGELAAILEAQHPRPRGRSPKPQLTHREAARAARPRPAAPARSPFYGNDGVRWPCPRRPSPGSPGSPGSAFCQASWSAYTTHTQMAGFKSSRGAAPWCSKAWGLHKPLVIFVFLFVRNCFIVLSMACEWQASPKNSMQICPLLFVR